MSRVINVVQITKTNCIEWEIPHFFPTSQNTDAYYSDIFIFHRRWLLCVHPPRVRETILVGVVGSSYSDSYLSTKEVQFEVKDCGEACIINVKEEKDGKLHLKFWNWLYEINKRQLLSQDNVLRGKVIISCNGKKSNQSSTAVAACQTQFLSNTAHSRPNFQDLLVSGRKSDASIEVQGRLFKVHKLILEVCSPVFSTMFDHDMSERNKDIIKIDDCDPDVFQNFLECLYSGKLEKASLDCLIGLYKIFDKYCVSDLKEKCSKFMVEELCEDTVLEVSAVADMFNDVYLKKSVKTFLEINIKTILSTEKWKKLLSENISVAAKILTKIVED